MRALSLSIAQYRFLMFTLSLNLLSDEYLINAVLGVSFSEMWEDLLLCLRHHCSAHMSLVKRAGPLPHFHLLCLSLFYHCPVYLPGCCSSKVSMPTCRGGGLMPCCIFFHFWIGILGNSLFVHTLIAPEFNLDADCLVHLNSCAHSFPKVRVRL